MPSKASRGCPDGSADGGPSPMIVRGGHGGEGARGGGAPGGECLLNAAADDAANLAQIEALAEARLRDRAHGHSRATHRGRVWLALAPPTPACQLRASTRATPHWATEAHSHSHRRERRLLDDAIAARQDLTLPEKLVAPALEDECNFHDLAVWKCRPLSVAHDLEVPLHISVTEAGTALASCARPGVLLEEGIGDTMRISLTDADAAAAR